MAGSDAGVDAPTTFSESAVDVPARLLKSAPLSYPQLARAAEFEGEVVVELVVGSEGSVLSARALTAHGLGLEAAALSAVQNYRFSAALRQGRPVQVRMRWTVTFRLS